MPHALDPSFKPLDCAKKECLAQAIPVMMADTRHFYKTISYLPYSPDAVNV
jgi:hypothetical protein